MRPITFRCTDTLPLNPEEIAGQILDLANWTNFTGYGVLPGIKSAEFEVRTPEIVGTRIRVTNTDRSSHVEEIVEWQPDRRVRLDMKDFSRPCRAWRRGSWRRGSSSASTASRASRARSSCTLGPRSRAPSSG